MHKRSAYGKAYPSRLGQFFEATLVPGLGTDEGINWREEWITPESPRIALVRLTPSRHSISSIQRMV